MPMLETIEIDVIFSLTGTRRYAKSRQKQKRIENKVYAQDDRPNSRKRVLVSRVRQACWSLGGGMPPTPNLGSG